MARFAVSLFHLLRNFAARLGVFISSVPPSAEISKVFTLVQPKTFDGNLVRIGSDRDGGYLVPDDCGSVSAVLSPGVGDDSRFEAHFLGLGIPCFLIDGSVAAPPAEAEKAHFSRRWLGPESLPPSTISLTDWTRELSIDGDLLLQMDIEGGEYSVLLATSSKVLNRFRVIIVEFHDLTALASKSGLRLVGEVFRKLGRNHFPVHVHPNNVSSALKLGKMTIPNIIETTWVRRDSYQEFSDFANLPHALDQPNVPGRDGKGISWGQSKQHGRTASKPQIV